MEQTAPENNWQLWTYINRPSAPSTDNGFGIPHFRHNKKANVLFCDGHVKAVSKVYGEPENEAKYWNPYEP